MGAAAAISCVLTGPFSGFAGRVSVPGATMRGLIRGTLQLRGGHMYVVIREVTVRPGDEE